jgi:hypothetical protein
VSWPYEKKGTWKNTFFDQYHQASGTQKKFCSLVDIPLVRHFALSNCFLLHPPMHQKFPKLALWENLSNSDL